MEFGQRQRDMLKASQCSQNQLYNSWLIFIALLLVLCQMLVNLFFNSICYKVTTGAFFFCRGEISHKWQVFMFCDVGDTYIKILIGLLWADVLLSYLYYLFILLQIYCHSDVTLLFYTFDCCVKLYSKEICLILLNQILLTLQLVR